MISRGRAPTQGQVSKKGHIPKNWNFKRKRGLTLKEVQMIELGSWVSDQFCL